MVAVENVFQRLGGAVMTESMLWDRAIAPESPGGERITSDEAERIRRHHLAAVRPLTSQSLTTIELCRSLLNGADGYRGPRFVQAITGLLRRQEQETTG